MPRTSWLEIENSQFFHVQLGYYPDIVALFSEQDFSSARGECPEEANSNSTGECACEYDHEDYDFYGYVSTVKALQERLSALGISAASAASELSEAITRSNTRTSAELALAAKEQGFSGEILDLPTLTERISQRLKGDDDAIRRGILPPSYEDPRVFDDFSIKHHLRFLLDLCENPNTPVRMCFTDLKNDRCCFDMPKNVASMVREDAKQQMARALPLVVLTEGSTDARAISSGMAITHPHLVGYIQFMNFEYKPDAGTANAVRAMRAMASAGIPNRIVAILDNDAAGHEEIDNQRTRELPPNVRLLTYPHLDSLNSYPTHGFDGTIVDGNVNGTAASVELYFGLDVLTKRDGERYPVRWTAYKDKLNTYQGVVDSKAHLHELFMEKVKRHNTAPHIVPQADWSGIEAIIESIVHAFDK